MNKEKLLSLIAAKQSKMDDLAKRSEASDNVDELRGIKSDMDSLNKEISDLRSMVEEVESEEQRAAQAKQKQTVLASYAPAKTTTDPVRNVEPSDVEKRAASFASSNKAEFDPMEMRSITIGSGDLAKPTNVQGTINDKFNEVSSIIDAVTVTNAQGMGEYQVQFVVGYGTGGIQNTVRWHKTL